MSKGLRTVIICVLAAAMLIGGGVLLSRLTQYNRAAEAYDEAQQLAGAPDLQNETAQPVQSSDSEGDEGEDGDEGESVVWVDPYADEFAAMDFAALREVNSDVVGWISIPGTVVSYPLVYGYERDTTFYLNHIWSGAAGIVGSIFIDPANSPSLGGYNTVIYGHNMNNGSMFGTLKNYKSASYCTAHPGVYITTDAGVLYYEIFAAYEVSTSETTYQISFSSDEKKAEFVDFCIEQSLVDTGIVPDANDSIITLSTCTGNGHATRWVVQAVMRNNAPVESESPETSEPIDEEPPIEELPSPPAESLSPVAEE